MRFPNNCQGPIRSELGGSGVRSRDVKRHLFNATRFLPESSQPGEIIFSPVYSEILSLVNSGSL
jgi:hypothetical protein